MMSIHRTATIVFMLTTLSFAGPAHATNMVQKKDKPKVEKVVDDLEKDKKRLTESEAEHAMRVKAAKRFLELSLEEEGDKAAALMAEYRKEMDRADALRKEINTLKVKLRMPRINGLLTKVREKGDYIGISLARSIHGLNGDKSKPVVQDLQSRRQDILDLCNKVEEALVDNDKKAALKTLQVLDEKARYVGGRLRNYAADLKIDSGSLQDMEWRRNDITELVAKVKSLI